MSFYIEDDRIMKKYTRGFSRKGNDIEIVVIHGAKGSAKGIIKWVLDGGMMPDGSKREDDYYKGIGLFHFINDRDGTVYRTMNEKNHLWTSQAQNDEYRIIAIENSRLTNTNSDPLTPEQNQSLPSFIYKLKLQYPKIHIIRTHDYYRRLLGIKPKPCPGKFDWPQFIDNMNMLNMKMKKVSDENYIIL